jgi:glycosyltransferase involved in cell wall biosynthesis
MARELHVAALPFPSPQGTQAAIAAMMEALAAAGRDVALLTYAHGDPNGAPAGVPHVRLRRTFGDRSLRSGPSFAKIAEDIALCRAIARARAELIVAHHVEAAAAALLARARPWIFVAHTALGPELPFYLPRAARRLGAIAARAGDAVDVVLARSADAVLAVSPSLASRITVRAAVPARWLPLPWPVPPPIVPAEAERARAALNAEGELVLYAGNLDAYQGLDGLIAATGMLAARRRKLRLLVATAAERGLGIDAPHVRVVPLAGGEARRRLLHAAADVVAVPRAAEGGLPIKLIDALARGVPVATVERACAGLALNGVAEVAKDDDPSALAAAIERLLECRTLAAARAVTARAWVAHELSRERFLGALDAARTDACARHRHRSGLRRA